MAPAHDEPSQEPELPVEEPAPPAPRTRGRPAGAKDKQPRKRPVRAAAWADEEDAPPPRPPTRRSAPPKKSARRVRIVESASSASSAAEEDEELSPRTARHRQWAVYRQQRTDAHQANVNRYAALFDRMLA